MEEEPPDELLCPITFELFRDPVICLADGRTYECSALCNFWAHRPLADFLGGPRLPHGRMVPAVAVRDAVRSWLDLHPGATPSCWNGRDAGRYSSQEELDRIASEFHRRAAALAASEAAEHGGAEAEQAAAQVLKEFAESVSLVGNLPREHRGYIGRYDRCDGFLAAGRFVYAKRGEPEDPSQPMLWFATNGFWHAGERRYVGQTTGWLIVCDAAASPELISSFWQVCTTAGYRVNRSVRCIAEHEGIGAVLAAATNLHWDDATTIDNLDRDEGDSCSDTFVEDDSGSDSDGSSEDMLATSASSVHLAVAAAGPPLGERRARDYLILIATLSQYLGTYDRCPWGTRVNGRFAYLKRGDEMRMIWFANGFWHAGLTQHLGQQAAALFVHDMSRSPEEISSCWEIHDSAGGVGCVSVPELICVSGPAVHSPWLSLLGYMFSLPVLCIWLLGFLLVYGAMQKN